MAGRGSSLDIATEDGGTMKLPRIVGLVGTTIFRNLPKSNTFHKTNIFASKNDGFQWESPFPGSYFQVQHVSFKVLGSLLEQIDLG